GIAAEHHLYQRVDRSAEQEKYKVFDRFRHSFSFLKLLFTYIFRRRCGNIARNFCKHFQRL
ncbi:MAG: hypothetical protein K2G87_09470, partial [Oscillospiraceae bacterium]|nr:hypothetical protein [Oscillospiraceae bacterium]